MKIILENFGATDVPVLDFCDISCGSQSPSAQPYLHLTETYVVQHPEIHL